MKFLRRKGKEFTLSERLDRLKKDGFFLKEDHKKVKDELYEELKDEFIEYNITLNQMLKDIELKNIKINISTQEIRMLFFEDYVPA